MASMHLWVLMFLLRHSANSSSDYYPSASFCILSAHDPAEAIVPDKAVPACGRETSRLHSFHHKALHFCECIYFFLTEPGGIPSSSSEEGMEHLSKEFYMRNSNLLTPALFKVLFLAILSTALSTLLLQFQRPRPCSGYRVSAG
jgi:hypothetical protein